MQVKGSGLSLLCIDLQSNDGKAVTIRIRTHALYDNQVLIAIFRKLAIIASMNSKQTKTLKAIFAKPVARNIKFSEIEALVIALGGEVREGDGSRVVLLLGGGAKHAHRPHPGKEAKQYQIKEIRDWLTATGVKV